MTQHDKRMVKEVKPITNPQKNVHIIIIHMFAHFHLILEKFKNTILWNTV